MTKGKELALKILKQYQDHCETTIDSGESDDDVENLKDVNKAIKWVESK